MSKVSERNESIFIKLVQTKKISSENCSKNTVRNPRKYQIMMAHLSNYEPTFWRNIMNQVFEALSISKSEFFNATSGSLLWKWICRKFPLFSSPNYSKCLLFLHTCSISSQLSFLATIAQWTNISMFFYLKTPNQKKV